MKQRITIKNLLAAMFAVVFVLGAGVQASNAQYIVDFEDATKGSYASGTVNLNGIDWNMTEAVVGNLAADWKNGARSARMRGYGTSSMTMLANKSNGLGTLSFNYRRYGTDAQVDWMVEYSTDDGVTWTQIGESFTAPANNDVQEFNESLNITGNVRIRIKRETETGTSNNRLNIDDITLTDFTLSPLINSAPQSFSELSYSEGNGPSNEESFTVSGSNLSSDITITPPNSFEISTTTGESFSATNPIILPQSDGSVGSTTIYVRLKAGLAVGEYNDEIITIASTDATTNNVTVSGQVSGAFALPYENAFRTQEDVDAAIAQGVTLNGGTTFISTAGGYVRIANEGNIEFPIQNLTGLDALYFSMSLTTFGGTTGQVLSIELSADGGTSYTTVESFAVTGSYITSTSVIDLGTAYNVENARVRFRITDGSNQVRIRDLEIKEGTIAKATITGAAGWRMLSSPVQNMPISVFDGKAGIQGFDNDGFKRNLFTGYDGTDWTPSGDNSTAKPTSFESGRGIMLYLYNNDQAGSTPIGSGLEITASGLSPSEDVEVSVHQDGEHKINFLGNPFNEPILVSELTGNGDFLANVLVYDHEDGFISSSDELKLNGKIAPWQGFLLGNTDATSITIPTSAKTTGGNFLKENRNWSQLQFILSSVDGDDVQIRDRSIIVQLREEEDLARFELPKMSPMSQPSAMMYFVDNTQEQTRILGQVARSKEIPNRVEIPFDVVSYGAGDRFRIEWPLLRDIPEDIDFFIVDTLTGDEIPLTDGTYFDFVIDAAEMAKSDGLIAEADVASSTTRFKLVGENARTTSLENADQMPSEVALAQNFPNPFNPTTRISYQLPAESQVQLAVYDLLGRQVAVLVNDRMAPGSHFVNFNAESLSSGVYVYRLEASGVVLTQKMTLVK